MARRRRGRVPQRRQQPWQWAACTTRSHAANSPHGWHRPIPPNQQPAAVSTVCSFWCFPPIGVLLLHSWVPLSKFAFQTWVQWCFNVPQVQGLLPLEPLQLQAAQRHAAPTYRNRRLRKRDGGLPAGDCQSRTWLAASVRLACMSRDNSLACTVLRCLFTAVVSQRGRRHEWVV